jgi:hypothetical protein
MKRIIKFNQGIIGGICKDTLVEILPQLEKSFRQRKTYHEYYFINTEVSLTLEELDKISTEFTVVLDYEELIITV